MSDRTFFFVSCIMLLVTLTLTLCGPTEQRILAISVTEPNVYVVDITRVVDGDTFDGTISLPLGISYTGRIRCRSYDAFELNDSKGPGARDYLVTLSKLHKFFVAIDGKIHKDSFGRVLGDVTYVNSKGDLITLSEDMKSKGYVDTSSVWSKVEH